MSRPIQLGKHTFDSVLEVNKNQDNTARFQTAYLTQYARPNAYYSFIPLQTKLAFTGWDDVAWSPSFYWNKDRMKSHIGGNKYELIVYDGTSIIGGAGPLGIQYGSDGCRPRIGFGKSRIESSWMSNWFANCSFELIDMFLFDTSKADGMPALFSGCRYLTKLDISTWDTSNVEIMEAMFNGCTVLPWVNLSSFNTKKVRDMRRMFADCPALTELDLSNFELDSLTQASHMFRGCSGLKTLILKGAAAKKLASVASCPPLKYDNVSSLVDNQIVRLSGAVETEGEDFAFVVSEPTEETTTTDDEQTTQE